MSKINFQIEIVSSGIKELSSMGAASRQALYTLLKKHYAEVQISLVNNAADLQALVDRQPDLVFLGMKFIPVNPERGANDVSKIWLSQHLNLHGIAHTGSDHLAHQLEFSKQLAKQRVLMAGLSSSPYQLVTQDQPLSSLNTKLRFPLFVKPSNRGGGVGVASDSLVHTPTELHSKVQTIRQELQSDSLIEEYLPGREFSVAILKSLETGALRAMPIELVAGADANGLRILSEAMKTSNQEVVLPVIDEAIRAAVCSLAIESFKALDARHYGRIDIKCDADGVPHFLEANLLPSLIKDYGSFPKAAELNANLNYEAIILNIVRLALTPDLDEVIKPLSLQETFLRPLPTI